MEEVEIFYKNLRGKTKMNERNEYLIKLGQAIEKAFEMDDVELKLEKKTQIHYFRELEDLLKWAEEEGI